jgi:hypothetical protein
VHSCVASDLHRSKQVAKKPTKAQIAQAEADKFRQTVHSLIRNRHADWNDWEWDWLYDEARRAPDYIYTEKEQKVLDRLVVNSKSFAEYAGYSVPEMIAIAYKHRCDLDEDGQSFVEMIHAWGAVALKRRQVIRLARICRRTEKIGRDQLDDEAAWEQAAAAEAVKAEAA